MRLDSSGNLGLGVTPSAVSVGDRVVQVRNFLFNDNTNGYGILRYNNFFNGTNDVYINTGAVSAFQMQGNAFKWYQAASGTAGNTITFTQAMTLDASGALAIGTTSISAGARLTVEGGNIVHTGSQINFNPGASAQYELVNRNGAGFDFYVNSAATLAARITSGGDLLVGTTNTSATAGEGFKSVFPIAAVPSVRSVGNNSTSSYSTYEVYSTSAAAYRFYVDYAGTVFATTTTISAISDQRFKENIQDIDVGLNAVMALKPRKFDWKAGKGKDIKGDRGFIAQEFEQVFPDLIDEWKDPAPEGEEPYKSVRQDLIPVLVKAIQELTARVAQLESK
jgi:hypothetical protein